MSKPCLHCNAENVSTARICKRCGASFVNWHHYSLDNRYEIICTIKSGAMGCVYKARDTRLNNIVAIKKMISSFLKSDDANYAEQRFREEARLLSQLHHGGLPKVMDFFTLRDPATQKTTNYLVMNFIEGKDLETVISQRRGKIFSIDEATYYFRQILDILIYLHSHNPSIIYRDMKPSNIMLERGKIFLVDFGIARLFSPNHQGTLIGTPGYASPEQYKGFTEPRSDLYSLGVVMHYLLSGVNPEDSSRPPFTFEPLRKLNPKVPASLEKIIMSMVDFKIENRPKSAEYILEMLSVLNSGSKNPKTTVLPDKPDVLFEAIEKNDLNIVRKFIRTGININAINKSGWFPLHWAAIAGHYELVKFLLQKGANSNIEDKYFSTPLHWAAYFGHKKVAELLIKANTNVNTRNKYGWTALQRASMAGHRDIAELLISKGSDVRTMDKCGRTPLHHTSYFGSREVADLLIEKGADINSKTIEGWTPLHVAAQENQRSVAEFLIEKGAIINIKNNEGWTPLHIAANEGNEEIVDLLIHNNADLNTKDNFGWRAAQWAHFNKHLKLAEKLKKQASFAI